MEESQDSPREEEDPDNEPVDPRVEGLLEQLNAATTQINHLEGEHYLARKRYRLAIEEAKKSLEKLYKNSKKSVEKAKPYFDTRKAVDAARTEAERHARSYEEACVHYEQAREATAEAERNLAQGTSMDDVTLDALNHATQMVQESRQEVSSREKEHREKAAILAQYEAKMVHLEKRLHKDIQRSEWYYSTRSCIEADLHVQASNVQLLGDKVDAAKYIYKDAFAGLEMVSDDIHNRRRRNKGLKRRDSGFIEELETS